MSFTQDKWGIENMLSTRSSSEEKITEKLLGDDYEEDYSDSEVFATVQRNQMRWKIFGILSTAFLLISLISNAFQLYASNENKRKPSYIYCTHPHARIEVEALD
jgi:poly(A) polymerase Pap1